MTSNSFQLIKYPIKKYVVSPIEHLCYASECDSEDQILQDEVVKLKKKKDKVQQSFDEASSDRIVRFVDWNEEAKKKEVEQKALAIAELHNIEGIYSDSWRLPLQQLCEPSMNNSELMPSRVLMLNQIMDALKDPSLDMIGIYGIGGVGKTTLAKEVCARAREEELFDDVIMVSVSRFPDLRRIQSEIAGFLGLEFGAEDVLRRAKLLIVLDDVWQKLDLHAVGIPFGDECQGCKLLVSSRRKDVLSSEMGSQKDFFLDVLSGEESWSLFQTTVLEVQDPRLSAIAIEIVNICAGLPLLIILVSVPMKYKELYAWVDMLEQLSMFRNEDLHERVHKVVESSFENLPGEDFRSLFMLCASLGQSSIQVKHLLIYGMGLSLFRNVTTIEEARDELFFLIDKLKEEVLLLDGDLVGHVKIHDVVRDAAISIASGFQNSFISASETWLRDFPNKDCTGFSLPTCNIQDLSASLQCPETELFLVSCEDPCLEIPDLLFEGNPKLKVVDFTGIQFATRLPSSLGCLRNLDSLCFHRCRLGNISIIGELTQLKFLSFAESDIVELPREIEALAQLKLLDLTNCSKLQVIPMNVVSKLISLEELYMLNSFVRWDEEGNASLVELEKLSCLSSLEIQILNPKSIRIFSNSYNRLWRYKIIIGEGQGTWEYYERSRTLQLVKQEASFCLEDAVKIFLRGIEDLYLDEMRGLRSLLDDLIGEGFRKLRHLCIKNDYGVQHLIKSKAGSPSIAFPELESLRLHNLNSLKMICDGPLKIQSFRKLQILKISNCGKLKSLFSISNVECFEVLREMEVESCENMEAVVSEGSEDIELTGLSSLKLKNLPHLKGFCYKKRRTGKKGLLFHDKITFPNLMSLEVVKCKSLKYVFTRSNVKWLQQLKRLEITDCESVEEIIWHKENGEIKKEGIDKIVLLRLEYVLLKKLKNAKSFSCRFPVEFSSLTELCIHKCPAMEYFASDISEKNTSSERDDEHVILYYLDGKMFPRLTLLHFQTGYDIQHTIYLNDFNSLESLYSDGKSLNARNCNKLKYFFSFSSAKTQLLEIEVQSCHNMEAIVGGTSGDEILELTHLMSLKLDNLPHLIGFCERKEGNKQAQLLFNKMVSFPNLTSLVVEKCNSLEYVFAASMVKCLVQLKKLEISNCQLVEAIIQTNTTEENEEEVFNKIVFHKLESLSLHGLPNVKMFGCGYDFEFSLLRELSIECPAMDNFVSKYTDRSNNYNADEHLFNESVTFSNLESMTVRNMDTFRYLWHEKFILDDSFLKLKSLNIANCSRISVVFLANTLRRIQNLETRGIACFEDTSLQQVEMLQEMEVNPNEEVVVFPQLCSLKLKNLPQLTGFCDEGEQGLGMQVSFPSLKGLELCECKNFKYIFTATMVHCLTQLEKLEINNCELLEEILLSRQFDEMDNVESIEKIVFPKLDYLSLDVLPNLKRFGFGYVVEFQLLKELSISYCPVLNNFVSEYLAKESDECLFNEMVTFFSLERMKVSHTSSFKYLWDEKFTVGDSFLKLKSLRIEYCPNLSVVFPSDICRRFRRLEILYLCCCSRVEEIYQYEGNNFRELNTVEPFYLQDLEIWKLPSLKYIWSKDLPGASTFENLQSVKVVSCKDLMFVFPKSIAHRLLQLQHLKIGNSHMEVIIANTNAEKSSFKAPRLTVLQLENLYQMRNLYNGTYTFKCPELKQLDIYGCNQEMNFSSEIKSWQLCGFDQVMKLGFKMSADHKERSQSFFQKEFFRNLEELTLDDQGLKLILSVESGVEFSNLKKITLRSLGEESIPLLFGFLRRCSLEKLVFAESYLEEIFLLDDGEAFRNHLRLEHLELLGDDNLKHILKEDSRFNPTLEKLLTLNVEFCESLINIAPSAVSFENLTSLNISVCFKMTNLVTASTAQTLANLVDLKVSECLMMEEIVEKDEKPDQWISFHKLKCLELYDLPTLNNFSSSNNSFYFPSLEQVVVKKCFAMKNFCSGQVATLRLRAIHFEDGQHWEGDLNATIASQAKSRVTNTYSWAFETANST